MEKEEQVQKNVQVKRNSNKEIIQMKTLKILLSLILISSLIAPAFARPGEPVEKVLERYNIQGLQPYSQGDYLAYKVTSSRFVSQPTLFLKLGAKGVILEQNFL